MSRGMNPQNWFKKDNLKRIDLFGPATISLPKSIITLQSTARGSDIKSIAKEKFDLLRYAIGTKP